MGSPFRTEPYLDSDQPSPQNNRYRYIRFRYNGAHGSNARFVGEKTSPRLTQSSHFHHRAVSSLGKLKSSTSALTRSF